MRHERVRGPRRPQAPRVAAVVVGWSLAFALLGHAPPVSAAKEVLGIEVVPWSKEIEPNRFRSSRDWAGTVKHFKKQFAGWRAIKWHREVNLPNVKYIHIENTYDKRKYDGINIYELPGGHVRYFILERKPAAAVDDGAESPSAPNKKTTSTPSG